MQSKIVSQGLNNALQDVTNTPQLLEKSAFSSTVTPKIQQTISDCSRRPSTVSETKHKCTITSDKLSQLRKIVEASLHEHKTFTIKGGWQTIRNSLVQRGWVERYENNTNPKQPVQPIKSNSNIDDVCNDLPDKQDWETPSAYTHKCEKMIISRMLQSHAVDFYWNMRKDSYDWHHRVNPNQLMNRFGRCLFTSKEGLNLLLQQMHWHNQQGVAYVNFPRCYTLGFPDHYNNFIDDFRMTACMGILKWLIYKCETEDHYTITSPEGRVPHTAILFAVDRCNEYISSRNHLDIDREFTKIWNHEWDQFLSNYYLAVHQNALLIESKEWSLPNIHASARLTIKAMANYWPMIDLDGMKNIWILKPGNKCRGRGIQLVRHMEDVAKIMTLKLKYVVQKYIEKPLLVYKTKFDIRQWFMITCVQPLTIWMYKDSYLRFSTQIFTLDNFHESLHLTNHAVQCKYKNVSYRDKALPDENMWDCHTFKTYLKQIGHADKWEAVIYPGMCENIVGAMLACQETMDRRPNTYELFGADFILADDFKPWLLEINSSPDLSPSTSVTGRMCPQCLEDIIKVIIDRRKNINSDTGLFDLIYKQNLPRPPAYLGMSLSIRGRKIFKNKKQKLKEQKEKENTEAYKTAYKTDPADESLQKYVPTLINSELYQGPVIADLIEELHHSLYKQNGSGYEFIPARELTSSTKKKSSAAKNERVSKTDSNSAKNKSNHCNSLNRKPNAKENSKKFNFGYKKHKSFIVRSAYIGLYNEWKLKKKFNVNSNLSEKDPVTWGKQTDSILRGKNILSKSNVQNLNHSDINKNYIKTPRCLSSLSASNIILPQLNASSSRSDTALQ